MGLLMLLVNNRWGSRSAPTWDPISPRFGVGLQAAVLLCSVVSLLTAVPVSETSWMRYV